ncbi:glycosyltransferase family 4 protein [Actinomadura sp. 9N407]|uniref:glycosyltransferase family 4 protein n=1 Tax=Actinomadura sp. 9N407 TaxID=3375154 RepID=UPI0037A217ED
MAEEPGNKRARGRKRSWRKRLRPGRLKWLAKVRLQRSARSAVLAATRAVAATRRRPPPGRRLRVRFLLQHAYGTGGTIRTVLNLSGYLAREHDVEIVSVVRHRELPFFRFHPDVRIRSADDATGPPPGRVARRLGRLPSVLTPVDDASFEGMNLWTDLCLLRIMLGPQPDVLIGTRPSLNLLAAEAAPPGVVTIGQDHMNLGSYPPRLRREIGRAYRRLTAVSVLTERSLADYRAELAGSPARIVRIPNAVPEMPGGPSRREHKVILAAGRLTRQKGFDLLVRAYEPLAAEHPDWTLAIFGGGPRRDRLRKSIADRGLTGRVVLRARTSDLAGEMERASAYVLSSRFEGMPMVILEAMGKGLPVVAFDCPTGPGEMIAHGDDGLLVPPGDVAGLTAALRVLITDPGLRDRLGDRALASSRTYHLDRVGPQWLRLLDDLCRPPARVEPGGRPAPGEHRGPAGRGEHRDTPVRHVLAVFAVAGLTLGTLTLLDL